MAVAKALGLAVPCNLIKGCEEVLQSKYANVFGIPLAVWGIAYFTGVIVFSLLANHYQIWKKLLTWLLVIGAIFALIFLAVQFFVLKKVCQYCLTTDVLAIILLLLDLNIEHRKVV